LNTSSSQEKRKWTIEYATEKGFDLSARYCSEDNVEPDEYFLNGSSWSLSQPVGSEATTDCSCSYGQQAKQPIEIINKIKAITSTR